MKKNHDDGYVHSAHCIFLIQYHIIWCPKFRFSVLGDSNVKNSLSNHLNDICENYKYVIKAMEMMPDHIHIFLSAPHTVAPCDIVRTLKSITAIRLFKDFPSLKSFYARCGTLWNRGYFISTIGKISESVVKKYIESQSLK